MEHELVEQFNSREPETGFYVIRLSNMSGVLDPGDQATLGITRASDNRKIFFLFKSEMDAEEFINSRLDPNLWEPYRSPNLDRTLILLINASEEYKYVAINPPLVDNRPYDIVPMSAVIRCAKSGGNIQNLET